MRPKISREIKEKVVRQWIQGERRDKIAKSNGISDGSVTSIIKEASQQEEYDNMALFRQLALLLKENSLRPFEVGFAIRMIKIMEQNDIDVDLIEPIISEFTTYCFKNNLSFDNFVQSARECLNLGYELRISVQQVPEFIVQGKKMIDKLEEERQEILGEIQRIREERDKIIDEIEEYGEERQLIEQIKVLSRELDKYKFQINSKEEQNQVLKQRVSNEIRGSCALDELNAQLTGDLSLCKEENERLKKDVAKMRGTRNNSFRPDLQSSGIRI
jgi:hypothetical protein